MPETGVAGLDINEGVPQGIALDIQESAPLFGFDTLVMGGHGDAMVPMLRYSHVGGIPVDHFLAPESLARIVEHTRKGGAEILALKQTSSAYDSPAACIATMADAVRRNRRRILPCVAILDGEYGQREIAMGAPAVLGAGGLEQVVELPLTEEESAQIQGSADMVRGDLERLTHQ